MRAKTINEDFTYLKPKNSEELKAGLKASLSKEEHDMFGDTINALIDKGYMVRGVTQNNNYDFRYNHKEKIILAYYQIFDGNNGITKALTIPEAEKLVEAIEKYGYDNRTIRFELSTWQSYLTIEEAKELLKR